MASPSLRRQLNDGDVVVGTFQILDSPMVSEIIGLAGFDFVIIDQEHGPISAKTTQSLCLGAESGEANPIVRVRRNSPGEIQRALDLGAAGVAVPHVETAEEARKVVEAARFQPLGNRGLNPYVRASQYNGGEKYMTTQNQEVIVLVHIEGEKGVDNIEDIASVDGIDVLFLGPYDLSQSLGIPGEVRNPRVQELMQNVGREVHETNKAIGTYAEDIPMARKWIDAGAQWVAISEDAYQLRTAFDDVRDGLRR